MNKLLLFVLVSSFLFASVLGLRQKTQAFTVSDYIASTPRATIRQNGYCTNCYNGPENMYTASFRNKVLVTYQSIHPQDKWRTEGHVTQFAVRRSGSFRRLADFKYPLCWKMGGVATSADGSVIGVLCRGLKDSHPASKGDPKGSINFIEKYRRSPDSQCSSWRGKCFPMGWYSDIDSPLYLLEFRGGLKQNPDNIVLINHASGGWNYGHLSIELNKAKTLYFIDIKITLGPSRTNRHEGNIHFGIRRSDWTKVDLTDGFACGGGHTISNRLAYNNALDSFSRYCMIDTHHEVRWGTTPTPRNSDAHILTPNFGNTYNYLGGAMNIVSLGSRGWMASAVGPDRLSYDPEKGTTVGVIRLPKTHQEYIEDHKRSPSAGTHDASKCRENGKFDRDCCASEGAASCADGYHYHYTGKNCVTFYRIYQCWKPGSFTPIKHKYNWKWFNLFSNQFPQKRVGMVNLANFRKGGENSNRLLLGWSPSMVFQGVTNEYVVQEMDINTNLVGSPLRLNNSGWGEDNEWVYVPARGCVVFPFAWVDSASGPGSRYPVEGNLPTTKKLQMTSICP